MNIKELFIVLFGFVLVQFVFGAYFMGFFKGNRKSGEDQTFFRSMTSGLSWRGVIWSGALPALGVLLYYSFVAHVWLHLGRWPQFGEQLQGGFVLAHRDFGAVYFGALMVSILVVPAILLGCLLVRRYRYISIYTFSYSALVGLAMLSTNLAPHQFLNWFWD